MNDARSPMWVGVFLGLIVLGALGGVIYFSSIEAHDSKAQVISSKKKVEILENKLTYTKELAVRFIDNKRDEDKLKVLEDDLNDKRGRVIENNDSVEQLKLKYSSLKRKFSKYKDDYRSFAMASAVGEKLNDLTTLSGKTYQKVVIKKVDDLELVVSHRYGTKSFLYDELPPEFAERFQVSDKKAEVLAEQKAVDEMQSKKDSELKQLNNKKKLAMQEIANYKKSIDDCNAKLVKNKKIILKLNLLKDEAQKEEAGYRVRGTAGMNVFNADKAEKKKLGYQYQIEKMNLATSELSREIVEKKKHLSMSEQMLTKIESRILKSK